MAATITVSVPRHLGSKCADAAKRDGISKGKKTGLGKHAFAEAMLLANESAKASDDVLFATLLAEFPKAGKAAGGMQPVPTWRAYFNGSRHGMNEAGKTSTRYGDDGQPARRSSPVASNGKAKGGKGAKAKGKPAAKGGKAKGAKAPKASRSEAKAGKPQLAAAE